MTLLLLTKVITESSENYDKTLKGSSILFLKKLSKFSADFLNSKQAYKYVLKSLSIP